MDEPEQRERTRAVDDAVRAHLQLRPGVLPVSWVVLVATRAPDGGGEVMRLMSDRAMPPWELKGILTEALDDLTLDTVHDDE